MAPFPWLCPSPRPSCPRREKILSRVWGHNLRSEKKLPFPQSFRCLRTPAVASTTAVGLPGSWDARMKEKKCKERGKWGSPLLSLSIRRPLPSLSPWGLLRELSVCNDVHIQCAAAWVGAWGGYQEKNSGDLTAGSWYFWVLAFNLPASIYFSDSSDGCPLHSVQVLLPYSVPDTGCGRAYPCYPELKLRYFFLMKFLHGVPEF